MTRLLPLFAILALLLASVLVAGPPAWAQNPVQVTVSFAKFDYSVAEGESQQITIRLSADPRRTVVIPITVAGFDGATSADYSVPVSVTFDSGETSRSITFTAIDDSVNDNDEFVELEFGPNLPAGVTAGVRSYTEVSIEDNDIPEALTITFASARDHVEEGRTVSVGVRLSESPDREVVIPINATNQGGASSADYVVPMSVTFDPDDKYTSITFEAAEDTIDDDGESVLLSFGVPLPEGVSLGSEEFRTTTIFIIDGGLISLGLAQVGVGVTAHIHDETRHTFEDEDGNPLLDEDGDVVTRGGSVINEMWQWQRSAAEQGVYSDIPAAEGGTSNPYIPSAGDLGMWLKAKATFDLTYHYDPDYDPDDPDDPDPGNNVMVTVTGRTGEAITQQPVLARAVVSNAGFVHREDAGFSVALNRPDVDSNRAAQAFTTGPDPRGYLLLGVRLALYEHDGKPRGTWAVHADDDGKPAAAPLSEQIPLPSIDSRDDTFEELTIPGGLRLLPGAKYWIVISQTTPSQEGPLYFAQWNPNGGFVSELWDSDQYAVDPEQSTEPTFTFILPERTDPRTSEIIPGKTIHYVATFPADAGSEDGWSLDMVALAWHWDNPDSVHDDNPVLALLPWHLLGQALGFHNATVLRMSIEVAPDVTVQFGEPDYDAAEGETVSVELELSADPRRIVTVPITATGMEGATAADYSSPASVTFHPGETSKTLSFRATQDTVDDDDERVKLALGAMPDTWITAGARTESAVGIIDDDDPFVTVTYGQSSYDVAEGGTQEVTVSLSADPERTVIIPIETTEQGGGSPADYSGVPPSLTFNSGETSASFTVTVTDDDLDDDDERVLLEFGTMPDERVSAGVHAEASLTIDDDDDPHVTVQYGQDTQGVGEGETVHVTVTLSADPERTVTIPVTAAGQGGAGASDYDVPSSLTFNAGQVVKTLAFTATTDDVDDDDESVKLGFGSSLPARVTAGARTHTTLDIGDDDDPVVTVMFSQSDFTVAEGGTQQLSVSVSADPERTIIIPITVTAQGTVSDADYSGVPTSVTFNSGETSRSISFSATQDQIDDDGEGIRLGFGTMPDPRVSAGARNELRASIADDDTADVVLSPPSLTVEEEHGAGYTVVLATQPTEAVTVTISGQAGTDLNLESGRLSNGALTFTPVNWDNPQMVTVEAAHDDDGVSDHVTLTHAAAGGEYDNLEVELPVTVNDNDPLGIVITPSELMVDESSSADYSVRLATEPTEDLTVTITGQAGTDLTLSNETLTFTDQDWNMTQTVTVSAAHDEDWEDDSVVLTHTGGQAEYEGLSEDLPVTVDDNTGDIRLVDGARTTADGDPCEGRLEIYYDGEWGTICDDFWSVEDANVACRQLGFAGGTVLDWGFFRNPIFPMGDDDQKIWLDDLRCDGGESNLLECDSNHSEVGRHNCRHKEDVLLRCLKNNGPYIVDMEFSDPPGGDDSYDAGETVDVTLVWSEEVTVTSTPNRHPVVWLFYGEEDGGHVQAHYASGTGTTRTVFTHTMHRSDSKVGVSSDSLTLNIPGNIVAPGNIVSVATGAPAILGHRRYQSDEAGGGTGGQAEATTILGVPAFNDAGDDGVFGAGETVEVTFIFSRHVQVDTTGGTPSVEVLLSGIDARQAPYLRGSGAGRLVFGYTLTATDGEHGSLLVDPNTLALNGGAIRDAANNLNADIQHQGGASIFVPVVEEDTASPQLTSAMVDGSSLTLTYDEDLDNSEFLSSGLFSVNVNGAARSVMGVAVGQSDVALLLSPAVVAGDTVTVDYTVPTGESEGKVKDQSGNAAASFSGQVVTNDTEEADPPPPQQNSPATGSPTITGTAQVGETLSANTSDISDDDGADDADFEYQWLANDGNGDAEISGATGRTYTLVDADEGKSIKVRVSFTDDGGNAESLTSAATAVVAERPNTAATGSPAITGTAQVGETLSADTSGISDDDGADHADFEYQWLANDGNEDVEISGATGRTYTPVDADEGKTIKVRVSFTDDDGNAETLTSAATAVVAAAPEQEEETPSLTASAHDLPASHDGSATFTFELRFSEHIPLSYVTLRDHAFTVTGGEVTKARRLEPGNSAGKNVRWEISVTPESNDAVTIVLPPTTDCEAEGALCTGDGRMLSNRLEITVPGPDG